MTITAKRCEAVWNKKKYTSKHWIKNRIKENPKPPYINIRYVFICIADRPTGQKTKHLGYTL